MELRQFTHRRDYCRRKPGALSGWVVLRAGLEAVKNRNIFSIALVKFRTPVPQSHGLYPSKYADRDIPVPQLFRVKLGKTISLEAVVVNCVSVCVP
jgi:hypothetical protein